LQSYIEIRVSRFQRRLKEAHPQHNLNLILTRINTIQKRLARCDIQKRLHELTHLREFYLTLDDCIARIHRAFESKTSEIKFKLDKAQGLLKALNPSNVLERGYSYVETEQGSVVTSTKTFDNLPPDAVLKMHYQDGIRKVKKIAE
jgi:exodeoxyribonuclease VII large subunit